MAESCRTCGGPLISAADYRDGLCQQHRTCRVCGGPVDGNSVLCAEHRRERRERKAATRRGRKDEQARAKRKRTKDRADRSDSWPCDGLATA